MTAMTEHATLGLTVIDESGPEPVMHSRCWYVPPGIIEDLAAAMTLRYGQPSEMVSDPRAMARGAQRSAEEDGTVYLLRGEAGDG